MLVCADYTKVPEYFQKIRCTDDSVSIQVSRASTAIDFDRFADGHNVGRICTAEHFCADGIGPRGGFVGVRWAKGCGYALERTVSPTPVDAVLKAQRSAVCRNLLQNVCLHNF